MSAGITAAVDISKLNDSFSTKQWIAAALLAAILAVIWLVFHRRKGASGTDGSQDASGRGGILVGADGRYSTSKAVAFLWTIVVGYCLLALVMVATAKVSGAANVPAGRIPPDFVAAALKPLGSDYLILLGGPFAAAILAKTIVTQRTADGTLQKTSVDNPSIRDIVADDSGQLDLVDFQYVFFNLIAAVYVITQFVPHPAHGIPDIPGAFTALIGVTAGVYTGNKALTTNPAQVSDVFPKTVAPSSNVVVTGANLVVGASQDAAANVKAVLTSPAPADGSAPMTVDLQSPTPTSSGLRFTIPPATPPGSWDLHVLTDAGSTRTVRDALTVAPPPASAPAQLVHNGPPDPALAFTNIIRGVDLDGE